MNFVFDPIHESFVPQSFPIIVHVLATTPCTYQVSCVHLCSLPLSYYTCNDCRAPKRKKASSTAIDKHHEINKSKKHKKEKQKR